MRPGARAVLALAAVAMASTCAAAPVKVACFTKRVLVQQEGAPPVILITFDEDARTAQLFANAYGGIVQGQNVTLDGDTVLFNFTTGQGERGDVTIHRPTGAMLLAIHRNPVVEVVADCRKEADRRF